MNKFLLAIPALCDFITSTLLYVALNFIPGSIYQMMRGGTIITTFIFSICFLKYKVQKYQILGCLLAFLGVFVVGVSNMVFRGGDTFDSSAVIYFLVQSSQIVGYILIVISMFFNGFFFVFQQKLLNKYHLDPLEVVGYEGLFGLCGYLILLPIISFIPCRFGVDACVFNHQGFPFFQRPFEYFSAAFSNGALLFFCTLGIFSIATFNIAGVTVTKNINALARSIADVTRTILVWGIGLIVTVSAGTIYPNYEWQLTNGGAIALQLVGFVILVSGNLVYNKIIKVPGFDARPIDERQHLLESDADTHITTTS